MSVVYFNGEIIAESRALVSFRDRSFRCGDGAFDTARTVGPSRLATAST
jgi:branched-chain amino acid aminotransferase